MEGFTSSPAERGRQRIVIVRATIQGETTKNQEYNRMMAPNDGGSKWTTLPKVIENGRTEILWDFQIQTDRMAVANQLNIVVFRIKRH